MPELLKMKDDHKLNFYLHINHNLVKLEKNYRQIFIARNNFY